MRELLRAPLGNIVILAALIGSIAMGTMYLGYSIHVKVPLPHIELKVEPKKPAN